MTSDPSAARYVADLLRLYSDLPGGTRRIRPDDRRLARHLHESGVPLHIARAALMLATVRRTYRPASDPPLSQIRSLHYFRPVIEELIALVPDPGWLAHLARHFDRISAQRPASSAPVLPTGSCPDSRASS